MPVKTRKTKVCTKCKKRRSLSEFCTRLNGRSPWCKLCSSTYQKKRRKDYPELYNSKEQRTRARKNSRKCWLKKHYGLTIEDYEQLLEQQDGVCAICGRTENRFLAIDHDHRTGKIRGLLCTQCNCMLGNAEDSPNILQQAIEYLEK